MIQDWIGTGGRRNLKIRRMANVTMVKMQINSRIEKKEDLSSVDISMVFRSIGLLALCMY